MVLEADAPMHRIGLYSMSQLPLAILGSLASLASGSVSTALVALFHREEPELIVIACSFWVDFFGIMLASNGKKRQ